VVLAVEQRRREDGGVVTLVVMDDGADGRERVTALAEEAGLAGIELVDRSAWATIQRLAEAGIIRLGEAEVLHRAAAVDESPESVARAARARRVQMAARWLEQAERKLRMAALLADGGFSAEAVPPVGDATAFALRGLAIAADSSLNADSVDALPNSELADLPPVRAALPPGTVAWLTSDGIAACGGDVGAARASAQALLASAREAVAQAGAVG